MRTYLQQLVYPSQQANAATSQNCWATCIAHPKLMKNECLVVCELEWGDSSPSPPLNLLKSQHGAGGKRTYRCMQSSAPQPGGYSANLNSYAMTFNASLVSVYIVFGTFDGLLTFVGITAYLFYMFAIGGIFIIRRNESERAANPGRLRTGLWNPIIFIICSAFIVVRGVISNLLQGLALCTLALVVFVIFKSRFSPAI
jgi:hypothetical protein